MEEIAASGWIDRLLFYGIREMIGEGNDQLVDDMFTSHDGRFLYVSAQNQNNSGSVTTKIYVDGKQKKESTSSGAYVIATSSMSLGD